MTPKQPLPNELLGGWQLFGKIELAVGPALHDQIHGWIVETLHPLQLNSRFLNKILDSARPDVQGNVVTGNVHIMIFTPEVQSSNGQSWGFFRVEKKGDLQLPETSQDHAIAFYLYQEGA